jgi:hypothetical protein
MRSEAASSEAASSLIQFGQTDGTSSWSAVIMYLDYSPPRGRSWGMEISMYSKKTLAFAAMFVLLAAAALAADF